MIRMIQTADFTSQSIKKHLQYIIRMKNIIRILYLTFVTGTMMASCGQKGKNKNTQNPMTDSVAVLTLKKSPVLKKLIFPAELTPIEKAEIYAKVSGYIRELKVDIGDPVKKGEILAVLDAPELISSKAQANAEVQSAYSKKLTSTDQYKRVMNASKVVGTVAASELETARNQMLADSSFYEAAKSKLNANSQLNDYLTIRSPFDGIITQRNADRGTLIGSNASKPLFIVENVSILRLRIPVPEIYTSTISDTSVVKFTVDAMPGKIYSATFSRKSGSINLSNRTEAWEFTVQNGERNLKSGMFANATITFGREELSFLVPSSAIATNLEKKFVIRLKNGVAEWIDVKSGFNQNDKIEIFGAIEEGDILLTSATDEIKPGTKLVAKTGKK